MCIFISLVVTFVGARDFLAAALLAGVLREVPGIVLAGVVLPRVDLRLVDGSEVSVALPFPLSAVVVWRSFFAAVGSTVGTGGCYESISVYYNVYHKYKNLQ
jgi:hypothetical protein